MSLQKVPAKSAQDDDKKRVTSPAFLPLREPLERLLFDRFSLHRAELVEIVVIIVIVILRLFIIRDMDPVDFELDFKVVFNLV